jgi:hypothetical protein
MQWNAKYQLVALQKKFLRKNQMITLQPDLGVLKLVPGQVRNHHIWHLVKSWNNDLQVLPKSGLKEVRFLVLHIGADIA